MRLQPEMFLRVSHTPYSVHRFAVPLGAVTMFEPYQVQNDASILWFVSDCHADLLPVLPMREYKRIFIPGCFYLQEYIPKPSNPDAAAFSEYESDWWEDYWTPQRTAFIDQNIANPRVVIAVRKDITAVLINHPGSTQRVLLSGIYGLAVFGVVKPDSPVMLLSNDADQPKRRGALINFPFDQRSDVSR